MLAALTAGRNMGEQRLQQKYAARKAKIAKVARIDIIASCDGQYGAIYRLTPVMDSLTTGSYWEGMSIGSLDCTTPIIALVHCVC